MEKSEDLLETAKTLKAGQKKAVCGLLLLKPENIFDCQAIAQARQEAGNLKTALLLDAPPKPASLYAMICLRTSLLCVEYVVSDAGPFFVFENEIKPVPAASLNELNNLPFSTLSLARNTSASKATEQDRLLERTDFAASAKALAALTRMAGDGCRKALLFGAGKHTRKIIPALAASPVEITCIADDKLAGTTFLGWRIEAFKKIPNDFYDSILISTDVFENTLYPKLKAMSEKPVYKIYNAGGKP